MENTAFEKETEKALLISVDTGEFDAEVSINELAELADTAGAEVAGTVSYTHLTLPTIYSV